MLDRILSVEPEGMLIGMTTTPLMWKSPMDISELISREVEDEK